MKNILLSVGLMLSLSVLGLRADEACPEATEQYIDAKQQCEENLKKMVSPNFICCVCKKPKRLFIKSVSKNDLLCPLSSWVVCN